MSKTRALTSSEAKIVGLFKMFEEASDKRQQTIKLTATKEAVEVFQMLEQKKNICKVLKINTINDNSYDVWLTLDNFDRYINYLAKLTGLTVQIDGSFITFDQLKIENPMPLK